MFEVFETEAEAAEYCRPADSPTDAQVQDMFVVWKGKSTGVMSTAQCVQATAGVENAAAEGPMTLAQAETLWKSKQVTPEPEAGNAELQHVERVSIRKVMGRSGEVKTNQSVRVLDREGQGQDCVFVGGSGRRHEVGLIRGGVFRGGHVVHEFRQGRAIFGFGSAGAFNTR